MFLLYTPLVFKEAAQHAGLLFWHIISAIRNLKDRNCDSCCASHFRLSKGPTKQACLCRTVFALFPAIVMLFSQPDYGTMCLIFFLLGSILYLGGIPLDKLVKFGLILTPLLILGAIAAPYRRKRLLAVLNPEGDALNSGWQTLQSLTGISNGGLLGVGPGSSKSKWWTPETHTDLYLP